MFDAVDLSESEYVQDYIIFERCIERRRQQLISAFEEQSYC